MTIIIIIIIIISRRLATANRSRISIRVGQPEHTVHIAVHEAPSVR